MTRKEVQAVIDKGGYLIEYEVYDNGNNLIVKPLSFKELWALDESGLIHQGTTVNCKIITAWEDAPLESDFGFEYREFVEFKGNVEALLLSKQFGL